jgi:hypothetical protein
VSQQAAKPAERSLSEVSVSDLFAQILKKTGLDEQRLHSRQQAQDSEQALADIKQAILEHIHALDEQMALCREIMAEDKYLQAQVFGPALSNNSSVCDLSCSATVLGPEELARMLESFEME